MSFLSQRLANPETEKRVRKCRWVPRKELRDGSMQRER